MHLNPNRYLTGVFFIDARGSELNNLGQDKSAGTKNIIRTKALVRDGVQVPFRSGEAIRRDIRETLAREHPDTPMSPLERAGKVTVTADRFPELQASPNDSCSFDDSCESTGGVSQCVLRPPVDAPPKAVVIAAPAAAKSLTRTRHQMTPAAPEVLRATFTREPI